MPVLSARKHAQRNLVRAACQTEWQIEEQKLEAICELLSVRSEGLEYSADEIRVRIGATTPKAAGEEGDDDDYQGPVLKDGVAVLPLHGVLAPKMNLLMSVSGGTSTQQFAQWFRDCMANPECKEIVIDVDSPGGTAQGNEEVANLIRSARGKGKKITAVANGQMYSAAYYIASAADEVVASPSAGLGSIGTFMIHRESSRADQNAGHTFSVIKAGANKAAGNSTEPLNSSSRAVLQEGIDDLNKMFVQAVAKNRGITAEQVEENFGQGKTMLAPRALAAGMADRIATLDQVTGEARQRARGKKITPFDVAVIGAETQPQPNQSTGASSVSPEPLVSECPGATSRSANKNPSHHRNENMNPRIKQALVARGLIQAEATDVEAQIALNAFFAAAGGWEGKTEDQIVAALSPTAHTAAREATNLERARIQDLQARAELLGVGQVDLQAAIDGGLQVEDALVKWTDKMAASNKPVRLESGEAAADKFQAAAVDVLWHRSGSPAAADAKPLDAGRDLRRKTLVQIAELSLATQGVRTAGMDGDDIATLALRGNMDTIIIRQDGGGDSDYGYGRPGDFPNILSALAGKMLDLPLDYYPSTYRDWAFELPAVPDFKPKTIMAAGEFGEMPRVPDGEDFTQSNIAEEASWIATDAYGDEFALTPRMVVDDNLGVFEEAVRDKAVAHDMTLNRLCVELLTGNQIAGDGFALFDNTHHANDVTPGAAPSQTQLDTVRQKLRAQTGVSKKRKLNLTIKLLLIPLELETTTQQLLSTNVRVIPVTTSTGEIFRGMVDYRVEPMLSDASAVQWYAFAPRAIVRPIVYTHQTGFESMKSRLYFNPKNNSRVFQAEGRFAAAIRQWRGVVRNAGQ